jgi:hypothetical protein
LRDIFSNKGQIRLKSLAVASNNLGAKDIVSLLEIPTLETLDVSFSALEVFDGEANFSSFTNSAQEVGKSLKCINFNGNLIGDEGAVSFVCPLLSSCKQLDHIILSNCEMGVIGVVEVLKTWSMSINKADKIVNISGNPEIIISFDAFVNRTLEVIEQKRLLRSEKRRKVSLPCGWVSSSQNTIHVVVDDCEVCSLFTWMCSLQI